MPTQELNINLSVVTWTNTTGGNVLITSAEATGPGQDGQGSVTIPGVGGTGSDGYGSGADADGAGAGAGEGHATLFGDDAGTLDFEPGNTSVGPFEGPTNFILYGGGGASSVTAGGGSGGRVEGAIPSGTTCSLSIGGIGGDTYIESGDRITAASGGAAVGDVPGEGGQALDDVGWSTDLANGNDGTSTTITAGNGGNGGNWASVDFSDRVIVANGDEVTIADSSSEATVVGIGAQANALVVSSAGTDALTYLPGGILLENQGGLGSTDNSTNGGGGGGAATANGYGADVGSDIQTGGLDGDGNPSGGDGGDSENAGHNAVSPGGGGGGDSIAGFGVGLGQPGRASFTYTVLSSITQNAYAYRRRQLIFQQ